MRIIPSIFLSSRMGDDPHDFLVGVYKIVRAMGVSSKENAELASGQLTEVAQVCFTQW